ncbi:hypothetical protein HNR44_001557 [Geomicrobium halophilum]|uniref:Uncharacterized protein n=1 Tax=Geomicrobium halophilum TaxID=549000 RepID=A0A841Q1C3_9BACL|nr:hypothetical protein [Geomicrobium halophilum]MBB6449608.1 hypothetical protein [Geomicrobium halophilum]
MRNDDSIFFKKLNPEARRRLIEKESKYQVVNTETGEIIQNYKPAPVVPYNQKQSYDKFSELRQHHKENGGFVLALCEEGQHVGERLENLTQAEYALLMVVGTYAAYPVDGNVFCYLRHDNGRYISKKGLVELLNIAERTFRQFYGKLISNEIIEENEDGEKLAINPMYFFRGDLDTIKPFAGDMKSIRIYRQTIRDLNKKFTGKSRKQLGLVYAVLPFVHFRYNILCANPSENYTDDVTPLSLGTLAEFLGYGDPKKLRQALRGIRVNGRPVFQFVEDDKDVRKRKIIVNPKVMFGGNSEALESISALFNESN